MLVLESQTPSKSVTYVSGLNCYLCARLDSEIPSLTVGVLFWLQTAHSTEP